MLAAFATVAAVASPTVRSLFSGTPEASSSTITQPKHTPLVTAPNQTTIRMDDGGIAYATDNKISAFHGTNPRHRELIGLRYTPGSVDDTDYHPLLWRSVEMSLEKGDGSVAEVTATRPLWWFEITKATEGATVPLDIHEAGITGMATVHKITSLVDRPYEASTPGFQPVIGTIKHHNAKVIELTFEGAEDEPVGVTASHPFWSEDRKEWIPTGDLRIGEMVATTDASARLLRRQAKPGLHTVYNIEVHRTHSYHVGKLGLMAHNTGLDCERVFSVYERMRQRHIPGDPVDAFERTRTRMNAQTKWHQTLKATTTDGVVEDIKRLRNNGELDQRFIDLATDENGFHPEEVFAARRFELLKGKNLSRSTEGADFFDGTTHWDAKGPIPAKFFKWEGTGGVKAAIDKHYQNHWPNKDESLLFDVAGLDPSDQKRIADYLAQIDPNKELYEVLFD